MFEAGLEPLTLEVGAKLDNLATGVPQSVTNISLKNMHVLHIGLGVFAIEITIKTTGVLIKSENAPQSKH